MKFGWSLALAALFAMGFTSVQASAASKDKGKTSSSSESAKASSTSESTPDAASDKNRISYAIGFQAGTGIVNGKMDVDIATVVRAVEDAYAKKTPDKDRLSYMVGFQFGSTIADPKLDIDIATVVRAVQDAYAKKSPAMSEDQMRDALAKLEAKMKADASKALDDSKRDAENFMKDNSTKKGVTVLPSGVQYKSIEDGSGAAILPTSEVTFHVRVSLTSGREIRSTFAGDPIKAKVSELSGIFGTKLLTDVIQKMKVGDHWWIYLPPEQASGNQILVWEVKIVGVK